MNVILVAQFILLSLGVLVTTFGVATTSSKEREASMGITALLLGIAWLLQLSIMIYYFAAIYPAFSAPTQ